MGRSTEIHTELSALSTAVTNLPVENPFYLPEGYFTDFAHTIVQHIQEQEILNQEEVLPPALLSLKKENPFHIPKDYFSDFKPAQQQSGSVILLWARKTIVRYAAAACLSGGLGFVLYMVSSPRLQPPVAIVNQPQQTDQFSEESITQYFQGLDDWNTSAEKEDGFPEGNLLVDLNRESISTLLSGMTEQGINQYIEQQHLNENVLIN